MTTNAQIADHLRKISNLFVIKGDKMRAGAYARAADTVLLEEQPLVANEAVTSKVSGIGKSIKGTILEFFLTGTSEKFKALADEFDPECLSMLLVKGIGPKTAYKFSKEEGIKNFDQLVKAWEAGKLDPRFGEGIKQALERQGGRIEYHQALGLAETVQDLLLMHHDEVINRIQMCGSLRRKKTSIKDIDFVVSGKHPEDAKTIIDTFVTLGKVINHGDTKAAIWYTLGEITMQVDLLVVPDESFGSAIQYFTGSKEHNIEIRTLAHGKGMKVSEYGIIDIASGKTLGGKNEEDIYNILGIAMPKPEDR